MELGEKQSCSSIPLPTIYILVHAELSAIDPMESCGKVKMTGRNHYYDNPTVSIGNIRLTAAF